jgi:hypothetical protein
MPLPAGRHADAFSTVGKPLPTSFRQGVDLLSVAEPMGHASLETTPDCTLPSHDDMQRTVDLLTADE